VLCYAVGGRRRRGRRRRLLFLPPHHPRQHTQQRPLDVSLVARRFLRHSFADRASPLTRVAATV